MVIDGSCISREGDFPPIRCLTCYLSGEQGKKLTVEQIVRLETCGFVPKTLMGLISATGCVQRCCLLSQNHLGSIPAPEDPRGLDQGTHSVHAQRPPATQSTAAGAAFAQNHGHKAQKLGGSLSPWVLVSICRPKEFRGDEISCLRLHRINVPVNPSKRKPPNPSTPPLTGVRATRAAMESAGRLGSHRPQS